MAKVVFQKNKQWYKSKTMWLAIITALVGMLTYVNGSIESGVTITAIGLLNAALRSVTSSEITL